MLLFSIIWQLLKCFLETKPNKSQKNRVKEITSHDLY